MSPAACAASSRRASHSDLCPCSYCACSLIVGCTSNLKKQAQFFHALAAAATVPTCPSSNELEAFPSSAPQSQSQSQSPPLQPPPPLPSSSLSSSTVKSAVSLPQAQASHMLDCSHIHDCVPRRRPRPAVVLRSLELRDGATFFQDFKTFHAVLHKRTDDMAVAATDTRPEVARSAAKRIANLRRALPPDDPTAPVAVDPVDGVWRLIDRQSISHAVQLAVAPLPKVQNLQWASLVPGQPFHDVCRLLAHMRFPVILKRRLACGTKASHEMVIAQTVEAAFAALQHVFNCFPPSRHLPARPPHPNSSERHSDCTHSFEASLNNHNSDDDSFGSQMHSRLCIPNHEGVHASSLADSCDDNSLSIPGPTTCQNIDACYDRGNDDSTSCDHDESEFFYRDEAGSCDKDDQICEGSGIDVGEEDDDDGDGYHYQSEYRCKTRVMHQCSHDVTTRCDNSHDNYLPNSNGVKESSVCNRKINGTVNPARHVTDLPPCEQAYRQDAGLAVCDQVAVGNELSLNNSVSDNCVIHSSNDTLPLATTDSSLSNNSGKLLHPRARNLSNNSISSGIQHNEALAGFQGRHEAGNCNKSADQTSLNQSGMTSNNSTASSGGRAADSPCLRSKFLPSNYRFDANHVIAQEFVPEHGSVVYKIYAIGDRVEVKPRTSVTATYDAPVSSSHTNAKMSLPYFRFDSQDINKREIPTQTSADVPPPSHELALDIVKALSKELGLTLLGIDVVYNVCNGMYAVVDVNYFPGYKGVEDVHQAILDHVMHLVEQRFQKFSCKGLS